VSKRLIKYLSVITIVIGFLVVVGIVDHLGIQGLVGTLIQTGIVVIVLEEVHP